MPTPREAHVTDLKSPGLMYLKAGLFLVSGGIAATLILLDHPTLKVAALLAVAVWCFARFYYFAFYVVEHYIDGRYRFSGLGSFLAYLVRERFRRSRPPRQTG